jgi:hypothetical protein
VLHLGLATQVVLPNTTHSVGRYKVLATLTGVEYSIYTSCRGTAPILHYEIHFVKWFLHKEAQRMDLLLDETTHDLIFINGACPVTTVATQTVAQKLKVHLQTFLGEWFLDEDVGIPYHQKIFGKHSSNQAVDLIFQTKILETAGVLEIIEFDSMLDVGTRRYSLTFVVRTTDGLTDQITLSV